MMRTTFADGCTGAASLSRYATVPLIPQQFHTPYNQKAFINNMKTGFLVRSTKVVSEIAEKRFDKDRQDGVKVGGNPKWRWLHSAISQWWV